MKVINRLGELEDISFDKIKARLEEIVIKCKVTTTANANTNNIITNSEIIETCKHVIMNLKDNVHTSELDDIMSDLLQSKSYYNSFYGKIAVFLLVDNLHKSLVASSTSNVNVSIQDNLDQVITKAAHILSPHFQEVYNTHKTKIKAMLDYSRDYILDYFGFSTFKRLYLIKVNDQVIETPQCMFMRVSLALHGEDLENVKKTYDMLSLHRATHASPTLFNAGLRNQQLLSCFLLGTDDSLEGIFKTITDCAKIQKLGGGIGINISNIRGKGSKIHSNEGKSSGILPMLKVYNETTQYINQCFLPQTIIFTSNGPMQIQDIRVGCRVITENGRFNRVNEVFESTVNKYILQIETAYSYEPVEVTREHQIFAVVGVANRSLSEIKLMLEEKQVVPGYYSASELRRRELVCFPKITFSSREYHRIQQTYKAQKNRLELCYLLGVILGDGNVKTNTCTITLGTIKKKDIIYFLDHLLTKYEIKYSFQVKEKVTTIRWTWNQRQLKNPIIAMMTEENIYNFCREKIIPAKCYTTFSSSMNMELIRGLIETDGSIFSNRIQFASSSKTLIDGLRYILYKEKVITAGRVSDTRGRKHSYNGRVITDRQRIYYLEIPRVRKIVKLFEERDGEINMTEGKIFRFFEWNGKIWFRISNISWRRYSGPVFDLSVNYNHNYVVSSLGLVHNSGKRLGSNALYLEPWHCDVKEFLNAKRNQGSVDTKARELFYALWVSDNFMRAVEQDKDWHLFCPNETFIEGERVALVDLYGEEFDRAYDKLVKARKYREVFKARELWKLIIDTQVETGMPYISFKCNVNRMNNQKNLGVIRGSNLCNEIALYSSAEEYAVCCLASISLPEHLIAVQSDIKKVIIYAIPNCSYCSLAQMICEQYNIEYTLFVEKEEKSRQFQKYPQIFQLARASKHLIGGYTDLWQAICPRFDFCKLGYTTRQLVVNLNKVLDINFYPVSEAEKSARRHRPIGIGVQGLHTLFMSLRIAYDSVEAKELNIQIFETIYYHALDESIKLAQRDGTYSSFEGSPLSEGKLHYDLWKENGFVEQELLSSRYDWSDLRERLKKYGCRNSTLIALMPTASSASIFSNTESFEVMNSNIYTRSVLAGSFIITNRFLLKDLEILARLDSQDVKEIIDEIVFHKGSVQSISFIPSALKRIYKTVWETPQRVVVDLCADRAPFVCQTMSMNLFMSNPTLKSLSSALFYGWKKGLKTGLYYLRSQPASHATAFSAGAKFLVKKAKEKEEAGTITEQEEECLACSA